MKKALIIGGSGGLSGRLAVMAKEYYEVWAVTRGKRPLPQGINHISVDRDNHPAFEAAILEADIKWDVVFDCICMNEVHARQDLEVLSKVTNRLVVISTDSVYAPAHKRTPQNEEGVFIEECGAPSDCSYAGNKRRMEHIFLDSFATRKSSMQTTILRPGHIYGPGFLLGCFPEHSREKNLPDKIAGGEELHLVGGGIYLTQPIFVDDLAKAMIDCVNQSGAYNQIFCIGGPEAVENRRYYEIIGKLLGKEVNIREIPLTGYAEKHPDFAGHLCHRIYDLSKLQKAGIPLPSTSLEAGLQKHLTSL